jgi:acetylornithine deacetylase/succinyl-diaminopimelate desuccinylase-like protein
MYMKSDEETIMEDVYTYIEENKSRFLDELFSLLRIPSISTTNQGITECAETLAGMMEQVGISTRIFQTERHPVVLGELRSPEASKTLLIYGHYDVQPPEPLELWHSKPFEPEIREGRLYGRGTADDKGQLFAHLKAVEALLKVRGKTSSNVVFLFEGEEEISSPDLRPFIEAHRDLLHADACLVSDAPRHESGRPTLLCGVKGMLYVELHARGANQDLHSMRAATVPSPVWNLVRALNHIKGEDDRVRIPGFNEAVKQPSEADLAAAAAVPSEAAKVRRQLELKSLLGGDDGYYRNLFFAPTCNIAGIQSGYTGEGAKTVLPSTAFAKIDFRLVPDQRPEDVLAQLRKHLDDGGFGDIEIVELGRLMPSRTPVDHPYIKMVAAAARDATGEEPVIFPSMGGSGPDYLFTGVLGLPSVWLPLSPHDSNNHAPNENILLKDFFDGIKIGATIIERLSSTL